MVLVLVLLIQIKTTTLQITVHTIWTIITMYTLMCGSFCFVLRETIFIFCVSLAPQSQFFDARFLASPLLKLLCWQTKSVLNASRCTSGCVRRTPHRVFVLSSKYCSHCVNSSFVAALDLIVASNPLPISRYSTTTFLNVTGSHSYFAATAAIFTSVSSE